MIYAIALGIICLACYIVIARSKYKFRNNLKAGSPCFFISENGDRLPGKIAATHNKNCVFVEYNKRFYKKELNEVEPRNTF